MLGKLLKLKKPFPCTYNIFNELYDLFKTIINISNWICKTERQLVKEKIIGKYFPNRPYNEKIEYETSTTLIQRLMKIASHVFN